MTKRYSIDKSVFEDLYLNQGEPIYRIAEILNASVGKVFNEMKKHGITTRETSDYTKGRKHTAEAIEKMRRANKGKIVSNETREKMRISSTKKGVGHKKKRQDGYISIYFPDHPRSNKEGYIMEHILVMSCYIGRNLKEDEVVHHINGKRDDNRIENLKLMTFKEHAKYHIIQRHIKQNHKIKRSDDLSIR